MDKKPYTVVVKIMNCKRGTAAWFHESRHKIQEERWSLISLTSQLEHWLTLLIFLAALFQMYDYVYWLALGLLINDYCLEIDAEIYAFYKVGWKEYWNRSWV